MQTNSDREITFWRGQWKDDAMTGVVNRQMGDESEEYAFSSNSYEAISANSDGSSDEETSEPSYSSSSSSSYSSGSDSSSGSTFAGSPSADEDEDSKKSWFY